MQYIFTQRRGRRFQVCHCCNSYSHIYEEHQPSKVNIHKIIKSILGFYVAKPRSDQKARLSGGLQGNADKLRCFNAPPYSRCICISSMSCKVVQDDYCGRKELSCFIFIFLFYIFIRVLIQIVWSFYTDLLAEKITQQDERMH